MKTIRIGLILIALIFSVSCGTGGGGGGGLVSTLPTWIAASWTGGAKGAPIDRTDTEATDWIGQICPASSVELSNQTEGAVLNIINRCSILVSYGMCVSKGSLPQPVNGMKECATDPFDTPLTDLTLMSLTPGAPGGFVNATEILSVNIFYCSDEQTLSGPPLRCIGAR